MKTNIELIKDLIDKEDDPPKLKGLYKELEDAITADAETKAREKITAENDKATRNEALETAAGQQIVGESKIELGVGEEIYGFNVKRAMDGFRNSFKLGNRARQMEEKNLESLVKHIATLAMHGGIMPYGINPITAKAVMVEGNAALGGYVTPKEARWEILAYLRDVSVGLQEATHIPMTSNKMEIPKELVKVSIGKTAEGTAATGTSATLDQVTLSTIRLDGSVSLTSELMADNAVPGGILAWLMEQFIEAMGQGIDSAVFIDDGVAALASGVFKQYGYSQVFAATSTNFSELLWTDIPNLISKIPGQYFGGNHKWYMNHAVLWKYFYTLKDSNNNPFFTQDFTQGPAYRVVGYPVRTPTYATGTTAAGGVLAVLTDLKRQYFIGDRLTDMVFFVNPYVKGPHVVEVTMAIRMAFANAMANYAGAITSAAA